MFILALVVIFYEDNCHIVNMQSKVNTCFLVCIVIRMDMEYSYSDEEFEEDSEDEIEAPASPRFSKDSKGKTRTCE